MQTRRKVKIPNSAEQNHIFEGSILNRAGGRLSKHGAGIVYGIFPVFFFVEFENNVFHGKYESLRIRFGDFRRGQYSRQVRTGEQTILTLNGLYFSADCNPLYFDSSGKFDASSSFLIQDLSQFIANFSNSDQYLQGTFDYPLSNLDPTFGILDFEGRFVFTDSRTHLPRRVVVRNVSDFDELRHVPKNLN